MPVPLRHIGNSRETFMAKNGPLFISRQEMTTFARQARSHLIGCFF